MDVDASLIGNNNAACCGLARNSEGEWIRGFTCNLGNIPISITEVKAIQLGMETCRSRKIEKAHIFSDSFDVVNFFYKGVLDSYPFYEEVTVVQELIVTQQDYKILHAPREATLYADFLAKQAHHHPCDLIQLLEAPRGCEVYLLANKSGIIPIASNII
ncbi:uncharacterized protein LOC129310882 [Prosopis cineraria]|uniref:uncharacterized protein LOC129310882 n=1 Tax=Prosopis cineraria TaxID=364024 RepID=UPI002410B16D|nr:uncharacterized protein LOC129310882 [Prosopis cineraria]